MNGLAGLFFFSLSLSGRKNYTSVCFQLSTQSNVNVNVIGESGWLVGWIGCFFHSPEHKGKISLPVVLFPHLLLSRVDSFLSLQIFGQG